MKYKTVFEKRLDPGREVKWTILIVEGGGLHCFLV
jgi:hypothetical protein